MDVAGQVQVEVFHRDNLRVAAAGCTALDAKSRPLRGLADASEHRFSEMGTKRLGKPNGCRCLAFTKGGGGDGGYINVLAIRPASEPFKDFKLDLCLKVAVKFQFFRQ